MSILTDELNYERDACRAYGVVFYVKDDKHWWARHNVAGVTGPFDTEMEAVVDAYSRWVCK